MQVISISRDDVVDGVWSFELWPEWRSEQFHCSRRCMVLWRVIDLNEFNWRVYVWCLGANALHRAAQLNVEALASDAQSKLVTFKSQKHQEKGLDKFKANRQQKWRGRFEWKILLIPLYVSYGFQPKEHTHKQNWAQPPYVSRSIKKRKQYEGGTAGQLHSKSIPPSCGDRRWC